MKTTVIRVACVAAILSVNFFFAGAQKMSPYFFDKKEADGKVITSTMYKLDKTTKSYEPSVKYNYFYNEDGKLAKEEISKWSHEWEEWCPKYAITHNQSDNNTITLEYALWNKHDQKYNYTVQKMVYSLDEDGEVVNWQILKKDMNTSEWIAKSYSKAEGNSQLNISMLTDSKK